MSLQELFEEVDKGRSQGSQTPSEVYGKLKKAYDSDPDMQENTDLLWRLARACLDFALTLNDKDAKKKDLFYEGRVSQITSYDKSARSPFRSISGIRFEGL
jgi:hypothetical protein